MKKGLIILIVFALSFGFLQVANNLVGGTATGETAAKPADGVALTGTAKGFGGDVTVTVTVNGDDITDVQVVGKDETQGVGSNAIDQLPALIVEADSIEVDGVSGATITSNAIKEAVKAALATK